MSKISEQKALEAYPIHFSERYGYDNTPEYIRDAFIKGYDQAIQDLLKDANQYMFLSDEIGYAYASGCKKTTQDFLEKACEWLEDTQLENFICFDDGICFNNEKLVERFKNYMQDEM